MPNAYRRKPPIRKVGGVSGDDGLVLGPGPAGRCDEFRLGGAIVDAGSTGGDWRMWYYCRDHASSGPPTLGTGRVALATSVDGVRWDRVDGPGSGGCVFEPDPAVTTFDALHVGLTDVTRRDGQWRMWTFGGDTDLRDSAALGAVAGLGMRPGLAVSDDGLNWTRVPGTGPGGALFDYRPDRLYAAWPNCVETPSGTVMQYTAPTDDLKRFDTYTAMSSDGVAWTQLGPMEWADGEREIDCGGIVTRQMLANPLDRGDEWLMIYTGLDSHHHRSICAATSSDLLHWRRLYDEPVFRNGEADAWDSGGVAATRLVAAGERLHLYYYGFQSLGNDAGRRGIGLATGPVDDLRALVRVPALQQRD